MHDVDRSEAAGAAREAERLGGQPRQPKETAQLTGERGLSANGAAFVQSARSRRRSDANDTKSLERHGCVRGYATADPHDVEASTEGGRRLPTRAWIERELARREEQKAGHAA